MMYFVFVNGNNFTKEPVSYKEAQKIKDCYTPYTNDVKVERVR